MNAAHLPRRVPGRTPLPAQAVRVAAGLVLALATASPALAETVDSGLTVAASGFQDATGRAVAKLFAPGDDVLRKGRQEVSAPVREGHALLSFPALPPGDYAVVVFHDANDNGEIDHNLLGLPKEALGFSGGFTISLTSGLPSFEKLRFMHGTAAQTISVTVR